MGAQSRVPKETDMNESPSRARYQNRQEALEAAMQNARTG